MAFPRNLGFAEAANEGIARGRAPFLLLVNNDAVLAPDYVARLAAKLALDERLAAVQGLVVTADGMSVDTAGLLWNARGEAVPLLAGEAPGLGARGSLRGLRRLGDGDPLSPVGAGERRLAWRGLRPLFLRLLRGRGPLASPVSRGMALRVRARGRLPPRGIAHRAPDSRAPRALDRAQPLAHAVPQFRAAPSREEPPAPSARGPRPRQAAGLARRAPSVLRVAAPAGSRLARPPAASASLRLARKGEPVVLGPRNHGDPRFVEGRGGRSRRRLLARPRARTRRDRLAGLTRRRG